MTIKGSEARRRKTASRFLLCIALGAIGSGAVLGQAEIPQHWAGDQNNSPRWNPVLEWNQVFIDTLVATNTANSSSQRLGAIVHTAIFDAYNGIERRYSPIFVHERAPHGTSGRAAVIAAAYTALVDLFPTQKPTLDERYSASLAMLSSDEEDRDQSISLGIDWGTEVALKVLAWRANDGFTLSYPAFTGGEAVGEWRPTPPAFGPMSAQGLAFTETFVLISNSQFRPAPPRDLISPTYTADFDTVKAFGRSTGSARSEEQTALALFWDGNASVHWNEAANQMAGAHHSSISDSSRIMAVLNIAMADTAFTVWSAKQFYGSLPTEVTWRPVTAIPLANIDGNADTIADPDWSPLIVTPSHPEYPAGHPSQNGAAATVLLSYFGPNQTFTLTTPGQPDRTYTSIPEARSDGDGARYWGGMHFPSTIQISDKLGERIATYVNQNSMQRLHGSHDDGMHDRE